MLNLFLMESYNAVEPVGKIAMGGVWIFILIICLFSMVCTWKMFEKMGEEGWKALIPIYNSYIIYKHLTPNPILMLILTLVPFVGLIVGLLMGWKLVKGFGKGVAFYLLYLFVPIVALPILAFGEDKFTDQVSEGI